MFLFSCAYAYAYVAYVMLIAQVGTRLNNFETNNATIPPMATSKTLRKTSLPGDISTW